MVNLSLKRTLRRLPLGLVLLAIVIFTINLLGNLKDPTSPLFDLGLGISMGLAIAALYIALQPSEHWLPPLGGGTLAIVLGTIHMDFHLIGVALPLLSGAAGAFARMRK